MDATTSTSRTWRMPARAADVCWAAFVIVVVTAAIGADVEGEPYPSRWLAVAFAGVLGALMLWRRRHPVVVLVATLSTLLMYYSLGFPPVGVALPVAAALYSVAEAGRLKIAIVAAAGIVAVSIGYRVVEGDEDLAYLLGYELTSAATLLAAVIALGDAVRSRRMARVEVVRRMAALERERVAETGREVEHERLRIARELHDVLAHTMSVISIQADVAAEALSDDPAQAGDAVDTIRRTSRQAGRELRSALAAIRSPGTQPRQPVPDLSSIDALVATAHASGLTIDVITAGTPVPMPAVVAAAAHRISQEAITNVLRHAATDRAELRLYYQTDALHVTLTDRGRGGAPADPASGYGLVGMRERVHALGGTFAAGALTGGGFRVHAELPLAGAVTAVKR